jgi:hypothetical protein
MKVLKVLGWLLLATLLLVAVFYLILVAINWNDRPPSAAVLRFQQIVADRPAVDADDNAVVYINGFGAPSDADPVEVGTRRMQWLATFDFETTDPATDPASEVLSLEEAGSPLVAHLASACGQESERLQCISVFDSMTRAWQPNDIDELALRRYEALLTRLAWREVVPMDAGAPWPPYANVTHAQRLYLLRLGQWAAQGRVDEVRAGLAADFAFWRGAIPAADSLIAQLIAVSALRQHFSYSNLIQRGLTPEKALRAVPDDWRREFSIAERSMKRAMAGELAFWKGVMGKRAAAGDAATFMEKSTTYLTNPLFKLQDTMNGVADRRMRLCESFEVPMNQYLRIEKQWDHTPADDAFSFYNPVGRMILQIEDPSTYVDYVMRAASVEGVRRAALLAVQLHINDAGSDAIGGLVENSDLRDPYTEKPFEWNAARRTLAFIAPDNHQRSRRLEFSY